MIPGFTAVESEVIQEVQAALRSDGFKALRQAFRSGTEAQVTVAGRTVFYVPDLPAGYSGMTMSAVEGFILGPEAMASSKEVAKTFLHETYRLRMGQSASGAGSGQVADFTQAAHAFAERAYGALTP